MTATGTALSARSEAAATQLERLRDELGFEPSAEPAPRWAFREADERFVWLYDGDRPAVLLDRLHESFELRCHGPSGPCPADELPLHYHVPTYEGVRVNGTWHMKQAGLQKTGGGLETWVEGETARFRYSQAWSDGSVSASTGSVRLDPAWGAYVVEVESWLRARQLRGGVEYCNVLPASIGDSRPGRERFPYVLWHHPDGLRRMGKNPIWWVSAEAQDPAGARRISPGGFIGFGPDRDLNPVMELIDSDPPTGAATCCNLQDEHVVTLPPTGAQNRGGWFRLHARYRVLSLPRRIADAVTERAADLECTAVLAWKFHGPHITELPDDLTRAELPGCPFYGPADFSEPVPWDRPYHGRLWKVSPDPAASVHYDRETGRTTPGSIRLRPGPEKPLRAAPSSGHTTHTTTGVRYELSAWVMTEGDARAWLELAETRFGPGDVAVHASDAVASPGAWTRVSVAYTARDEADVPFVFRRIAAQGEGRAWFTDMALDSPHSADGMRR